LLLKAIGKETGKKQKPKKNQLIEKHTKEKALF